jgi:hypothetical protein
MWFSFVLFWKYKFVLFQDFVCFASYNNKKRVEQNVFLMFPKGSPSSSSVFPTAPKFYPIVVQHLLK